MVWLSQFLNDPGHAEYYNFEAYKLLKSLYDNKDNILHDGIKNDLDNAPQISNFLKWGKDGLLDLSVAVSGAAEHLEPKVVDKILCRYLDTFNKIARIDGPQNSDTRYLGSFVEDYYSSMSTDTVLKYIETLKKWSFEKSEADAIRMYIIRDEFTKRTPQELSKIEKHLEELEKLIEHLPYTDRSKWNS